MKSIHPTAVVHSGAQLAEGCFIGPYCVIGEHVVLGEKCKLHSHVVIDGHTTLGARNEFFRLASLGWKTEDLKGRGGLPRWEMGDENPSREPAPVNSATADGGITRIGSHNHILAYA